MYLKLKNLVLIVGLSLCTFATKAQTANFDMTGTILPGVCHFNVNDVDLGTYYATEFTSIGTTTHPVVVWLSSTRCDPLITKIHMYLTGAPDADDPQYFRGVAGIGIELFRSDGQVPIHPNGTSLTYNAAIGHTYYLLSARFRQTAAMVASGKVRSAVTIQVNYN